MEKPYKGRAIIEDNYPDLQIIIPAKRNWFIIIFIGAWLCGWFMGEVFALGAVTGVLRGNTANLFLLFWLVGWTVAGFFVFKTFLWNLIGKEVITIGQGRLSLGRKGALLYKSKTYDLNEVRKIRVQDESSGDNGFFGMRRNDFAGFGQGGTIRFDYGLKTVKFAAGIDEAEGNYIINTLRERHLLLEKNFS